MCRITGDPLSVRLHCGRVRRTLCCRTLLLGLLSGGDKLCPQAADLGGMSGSKLGEVAR